MYGNILDSNIVNRIHELKAVWLKKKMQLPYNDIINNHNSDATCSLVTQVRQEFNLNTI